MLNTNQIISLERVIDDSKDFTFIVEGKRDKAVLTELGIKNVVSISGQSLEGLVEKLDEKNDVVILTDFDREGKKKAEKLKRLLRSYHIRTKENVRKFFKKSLKITKIEELKSVPKFIENLENYNKERNRKFFFNKRKRSR